MVFCPATMKGHSHLFEMSSPSIMTGIHKKEGIGFWRMDEYSLNEVIRIHPPLQMKSDYTCDQNLMTQRKYMRSPN